MSRGSTSQPYIVRGWYDTVFFLLSPVLALIVGIAISGTDFSERVFSFQDSEVTVSTLCIGIFIHAHLVLVFFRSHANPQIRRLHPFRFLIVPPLLFLAMMSSLWVLITVSVLATFWDVYHSGMQTFGLGRIYDIRAGNDPKVGRRLDWALNQWLYAGPIVAGATMIDHFEDFREYDDIRPDTFFSAIPAYMESNQRYFTWAIVLSGTAFLIFYVYRYYRYAKQGYSISVPKVWLFASTGLCSIYTWGFNSWGEAFFVMNAFHALQYFAIVWAFERQNLMRLFRLGGHSKGKLLTFLLFLICPLAYGYAAETLDAGVRSLWALTLIVAIMHFWYDGFVWSVQKKQV